MSRRKQRKAVALAAKLAGLLKNDESESARALRIANGRASVRDLPFAERMQAEARGRNGYTGETRGSRGSFSTHQGDGMGYYQNGVWRSYGGDDSGYGYQGGYQSSKKDENTFTTEPAPDTEVFHCEESNEIIGICPIATTPTILVPSLTWDHWMKLADRIATEWIAHLIGHIGANSKGEPAYIIERYYFPPQTASGAHVEVPTGYSPRAGVIGAVHSHVRMGVFFSATDIKHSNWPVEIVINAKREFEAVVRHPLKCGIFAKNKAEVFLTGENMPEGVIKALDTAFDQGKALEEQRRVPRQPEPTQQSLPLATVADSPTVPSSIAPEDVEDVAKALESLDAQMDAQLDSDDTSQPCEDCKGSGNSWIRREGYRGSILEQCKVCHGHGRILLV